MNSFLLLKLRRGFTHRELAAFLEISPDTLTFLALGSYAKPPQKPGERESLFDLDWLFGPLKEPVPNLPVPETTFNKQTDDVGDDSGR